MTTESNPYTWEPTERLSIGDAEATHVAYVADAAEPTGRRMVAARAIKRDGTAATYTWYPGPGAFAEDSVPVWEPTEWELNLIPSGPVTPSFAETHGETAALAAYQVGREQAREAAAIEAGAEIDLRADAEEIASGECWTCGAVFGNTDALAAHIAGHATARRRSYYATRTPILERSFPENVVTQGDADYCRDHGHAFHTIDGVDTGICPRCGASTASARYDIVVILASDERITEAFPVTEISQANVNRALRRADEIVAENPGSTLYSVLAVRES